jgi:hypothetical protein
MNQTISLFTGDIKKHAFGWWATFKLNGHSRAQLPLTNIYACMVALQQKKKLFGFAQDMHGFLLILDRAAYAQIPGLCKQDCVSKRRDDERSSRGKS